jgi:hypothetical protein
MIYFGFHVSDSVGRVNENPHLSDMEPRKTKEKEFLGSWNNPMKQPIIPLEISP